MVGSFNNLIKSYSDLCAKGLNEIKHVHLYFRHACAPPEVFCTYSHLLQEEIVTDSEILKLRHVLSIVRFAWVLFENNIVLWHEPCSLSSQKNVIFCDVSVCINFLKRDACVCSSMIWRRCELFCFLCEPANIHKYHKNFASGLISA